MSQKKLGPIGSAVLTFIGYKQTNRQTDRQAKFIYRYNQNIIQNGRFSFKMADFLLQKCINEEDCTWGKAGTSEKMRRGCPDFVKPPKNNGNGSYIFV